MRLGHRELLFGCEILVRGGWRRFRGRVEAHYVDGSYCVSDGRFDGSQATPAIDRWEPPGPGWDEIADAEAAVRNVTVLAILHSPDVASTLRAHFAGKSLDHGQTGGST